MFLQDLDSKEVYDIDVDVDIDKLVDNINRYLEKWACLNMQKIIRLTIEREEDYE